jgi:hypothetical protein
MNWLAAHQQPCITHCKQAKIPQLRATARRFTAAYSSQLGCHPFIAGLHTLLSRQLSCAQSLVWAFDPAILIEGSSRSKKRPATPVPGSKPNTPTVLQGVSPIGASAGGASTSGVSPAPSLLTSPALEAAAAAALSDPFMHDALALLASIAVCCTAEDIEAGSGMGAADSAAGRTVWRLQKALSDRRARAVLKALPHSNALQATASGSLFTSTVVRTNVIGAWDEVRLLQKHAHLYTQYKYNVACFACCVAAVAQRKNRQV